MRLKITIILLLLCLLFLCAFYFTAKPLIVSDYNDKTVELFLRYTQTDTGRSLVNHYLEQMEFLRKFVKGLYAMTPERAQRQIYFELSRLIVVGFAAVVVSVISLAMLIIQYIGKKAYLPPQKYTLFMLLLIILDGTIIRLIMASACFGNFDMQSCEIVTNIAMQGGNVYALTYKYNYSPIWFLILCFLKHIQIQLSPVSFHFVIRSFLCLVDLATLVFLLLIANLRKISLPKVALLFYLNPITFLLTGYHGQFENLAILMVIIGLYAYLKLYQKPIWGTAILWLFASAGMIIKHNVFYELIICLNSAIKRYWLKFLLFTVSVCIFLATFLPYWIAGKEGIIKYVFMYSSNEGKYGITTLFHSTQFRYLFIIGMFVFPLFMKNRDIIRQCLLGFLFFMTFTSGISIQYFVLPVAVGSLYSSEGFLFYSIASALCILGSKNNVYVPGLDMHWNVIWVCAIYWFFSEWVRSKNTAVTIAQPAKQNLPKKNMQRK
jgi:hypothetical protein